MPLPKLIMLASCVAMLLTNCQSGQNEIKNQLPDDAVGGLVQRIMHEDAARFIIEYIEPENNQDVFELESQGEKIVLRGNNGVSIASALNHYLKNYLHCELSWNGSQMDFPKDFPEVEKLVRIVTPYQYRYYLNYCTFNYSMSWWDWDRWQWEIDWMALNGLNMPLAITGEASIWQEVYHEMGFNDEQLGAFFSGPSYFSWLWMGNIDAWGGPLPQHWMDTHKDLQKKILARERALGMTPVLPAFTGHVPAAMAEQFPEANLKKTNWDAGFPDVYILDPGDPLFDQIGARFLEVQTKEYGTDHFYSADTFNENVPPTSDSTFLSNISRKVYQSMASTDPEAVWVMQGWMFHYNDDYWHPKQIQALLGAVPDDRMLMLDLYSESHPVWNRTDAYYGKPWIWNMLHNFGGNISMFGRMRHVAQDPAEAHDSHESGNMAGIGLTPEGIEQNPALYALMLENVWRETPIDLDSWLQGYARRRYGKASNAIDSAWTILKNTVYQGGLGEGGSESILVARPTFEMEGHRVLTQLDYQPKDLLPAWELFVEQQDSLKASEGYRYDLVDLTRQVLVNYANVLQQKVVQDYQNQDLRHFQQHSKQFLELLNDIDQCLLTREDFLLGKWIADARAWGETDEEKDLYEFNARDLVTLWGDKESPLHEYSNRQWAGLIKSFYQPRWERFFEQAEISLEKGQSIDHATFEKNIKDWEWNWVKGTGDSFETTPVGDEIEVVSSLFNKYYQIIYDDYQSLSE